MTVDAAPDYRLQAVWDGLREAGYDDKTIVKDYRYVARNGHVFVDQADLVAFSDPVHHDLQTSCIAVRRPASDTSIEESLRRLSFLAVPIAVIVNVDVAVVWEIRADGTAKEIGSQPYDRVVAYFSSNKRDFRPESIAAAKSQGRQLSFLDIDPALVQFAYNATRGMLVERFEDAVTYAREQLLSMPDTRKSALHRLTRFALQLLAAAILEDKGLLEDPQRSASARQLVGKARRSFRSYFDTKRVDDVGDVVADGMHDRLRRDLIFQSFTNELLGYFYENTFVDDELRRDLGVYYTPQHLARRILSRLPIEQLPPHSRTVLDGTCGSGSLLLAAYERLAGLLPVKLPREQVHAYLVRHLHGVDVDSFAAEVSRLSLFLLSVPSENGWDIEASNFLTSDVAVIDPSPTIIIGNPPFRDERSVEGRRVQMATRFLEKYLDLLPPDGLIGIVLPETFLETNSTKGARRRLLSECDVLEVWRLPEGTFPSSSVATAVVLARKRHVGTYQGQPVRIEHVLATPAAQSAFKVAGQASYSFVVPSQSVWLDNHRVRMNASHLDASLWSDILARTRTHLKQIARVRNGIITGKGREELSADKVSDEFRPWLDGAEHMEPYKILWNEQRLRYIKYPGDLQWPRPDLESIFSAPHAKVFVNSARAPGSPWRLYATVDDIGLFPSSNLHCIIPIDRDRTTLEELAAVLNSPVANAWIDANNIARWIRRSTLETMPYPSFTAQQRDMLGQLVKWITAVKGETSGLAVRNELTAEIDQRVRQIDGIVFDAFGISQDLRDAIYQYFSQFRRPGGELAVTPTATIGPVEAPRARHVTFTGRVIRVDAPKGRVRLWISGYNDDADVDVPIPDRMPGWLLREDQDFQAEALWGDYDPWDVPFERLTNYRPLDYSFLSESELSDLLDDPGSMPTLYGFVHAADR